MKQNSFTPEEIEEFENYVYNYIFHGWTYEKDVQEELRKEAKAWVESAAILASAAIGDWQCRNEI